MVNKNTLYTAALLTGMLALLAACGGTNSALAPNPDLSANQAQVQAGVLTGNPPDAAGIISFKGVPYASAPVGTLRWQAPQAVAAWSGNKSATQYGHTCWQGTAFGPVDNSQASEDCLFLNVWTGAKSSQERRPVMVWLHGGGFQFGTSGDPRWEGGNLAKKGVVVVTLNYRLGVFGFLARTDLDAESGGKSSGMYGLLDQIAALQWVKNNVAAFGGDPGNVTVFGESAGAHAVGMLLSSPLTKGLFQKAIAESGAFWETPKGVMVSHTAASQLGTRLGATAGASSLADLRGLSASQLMSDPTEAAYSPSVDGYVLPTDPYQRFAAGLQNDVPLLEGQNADEGTIFAATAGIPGDTREHFIAAATSAFGTGNIGTFLQFYPAASDAQAQQSEVTLAGDLIIASQTWEMANLQMKTGKSPVYSYYFSQTSPYNPLPIHVSEVPYVFQNLVANGHGAPNASDLALADAMSSYWTNFAKTGNPNGVALPNWPAYAGAGSQVMGLATPLQAEPELSTARFQFLNRFRSPGSLGFSF
ncbi:carboxylesterase/lipase family protein [Paraburkholderia sp. BCC1884]|uniref:carboxylesterase/lipase family protein n=1 Tax=Paraburkholderia sp. BCC1884 TaxID=2562668 RepID=UPI001C926551|nr:carboxylesterase family protein [Paraburkholderia sp. BCC1884]